MRQAVDWFDFFARGAGVIALVAASCGSALSDDRTGSIREAHLTYAGSYSFSDELGGFRIVSAGGIGTREDPIVIEQELFSSSPVTMIIRATRPIRPFEHPEFYATGFIHMRLNILNNSGHGWVEFELELQERENVPSVFGDGLSFDQRKTDTGNVYSDRFTTFDRDFEPYDRLLYRNGTVDPLATATIGFFITDYTPKRQFYLRADPRIPFS